MERRWRLVWVLATGAGLGVGAGLAEVVSSVVAEESGLHNLLSSPRWQISVGFCFGVPVLIAQYLVLRAFVPGSIRWLVRTALGLSIGAAAGAFVGLAAAMATLVLGVGCEVTSSDACVAGVFALMFPVAGGAAGAAAGGVMGVSLRLDSKEWLHEWTCPLAKAWAAIGLVFWTVAPALMRPTVSRAGLLDTDTTPVTVALMAIAGLVAGLAGGALSAGHFLRIAKDR